MLFAKNSDRQRNEAQSVEYFHGADHAPDARVTCTYLTIPQASRTHAVLLCRPFWIWGAEMGANEHGLVIGNEGLQARGMSPEEPALTGMDLLRLTLERATTAVEALEVITKLLERFGQGGNCGHLTPAYYNNGFMIADRADAFVLETVGREWFFERVEGVRSISNCYSVGPRAKHASKGIANSIREAAWTSGAAINYADVFADREKEHIGQASARRARSTELLRRRQGQIDSAHMMAILRDHGADATLSKGWHPKDELKRTLCLHACADDFPAQTTGSMVSELLPSDSVHWVTGTAAPCTAIFKPVFVGVALPAHGPQLTDRFDARSLWWRHECLHRAALMDDFAAVLEEIYPEREVLEASFRSRVKAVLNGGNASDREQLVSQCWKEASATEDRWFARFKWAAPREDTRYGAAWSRMNRLAGIYPRDLLHHLGTLE